MSYTIKILDKLTVNLTATEVLNFHNDLTVFLNENWTQLTKDRDQEEEMLDTITKAIYEITNAKDF